MLPKNRVLPENPVYFLRGIINQNSAINTKVNAINIIPDVILLTRKNQDVSLFKNQMIMADRFPGLNKNI